MERHDVGPRRGPLQVDLAQKYWDVANAIVAFSVLQMLAFLYGLGTADFRKQIISIFCLVTGAIAVSSLLYIAGVISCYWAERKLRGTIDSNLSSILRYTMWIRIAIIAFYAYAGIAAINFVRAHGK